MSGLILNTALMLNLQNRTGEWIILWGSQAITI